MIVGSSRPLIPKLGPVARKQQQPGIVGAYDKLVQQAERKRVVPVQVFEYGDHRLLEIFRQQQPGDGLIGVLAMLDRVERLKGVLGLECVKQVQHRRDDVFQRGVEPQYLCRHLFADGPGAVAIGDLEIEIPEEFDDRQIGSRMTIRSRVGLQQQAAGGVARTEELMNQP